MMRVLTSSEMCLNTIYEGLFRTRKDQVDLELVWSAVVDMLRV